MSARLSNGRVRGHHSFNLALAVGLLLAAIAFIIVVLCGALAHAHEAKSTAAKPLGWSYPFACCANYDCKEVPQSSIGERPEGYVIKGTGEVIAYGDKRIKDSPDGEYHWCAHQAGLDAGKTICLFVPGRGS